MNKKSILRILIFTLGGAVIGYSYYYFIGCRTGSCPLTSNPLISTLYGTLLGLLFGYSPKKHKDNNQS